MPQTTKQIEYLVGIVIVVEPYTNVTSGKKYEHGIKNTYHYKHKFCRDMKTKFINAVRVNFYLKENGAFLETIHLQ